MTTEIKELADRWILPLRGRQVTHIQWGEHVAFHLDPPAEITVGDGAILTSGPITAPDAEAHTLWELGRDTVAGCVGATVVAAVAFKTGALRIVFGNGWHLNVRSTGPFVPASVRAQNSVMWSRPDPSS